MGNYYPTDDVRLNIARGLVNKASHIHVLGYNPDIDTGTDPETVWSYGGAYPWDTLTSANTLYIESSNTTDTMDLVITGLDNDFNEFTEIVTLNGTTPVATTGKFIRINDAYLGSNINAGDINFRFANTLGTVVDHMRAGYGQNTSGIYTIPAGKTGYLYAGDASTNINKETTIVFRIRLQTGGMRVAHIAELSNGSYRYDFYFPQRLPEKADIEVYVVNTLDSNTRVGCNFDIVLIDN